MYTLNVLFFKRDKRDKERIYIYIRVQTKFSRIINFHFLQNRLSDSIIDEEIEFF